MVSYAVPGGGVGPHFDLYDVFLVQAKGYRSWKIGQDCDAGTQLRENSDLRLLSSFETSEEIITGPKDVLYLPPSKAHWGVAQSESITYSIGFRAPRLNDMIAYWTDERLEELSAISSTTQIFEYLFFVFSQFIHPVEIDLSEPQELHLVTFL